MIDFIYYRLFKQSLITLMIFVSVILCIFLYEKIKGFRNKELNKDRGISINIYISTILLAISIFIVLMIIDIFAGASLIYERKNDIATNRGYIVIITIINAFIGFICMFKSYFKPKESSKKYILIICLCFLSYLVYDEENVGNIEDILYVCSIYGVILFFIGFFIKLSKYDKPILKFLK